MESRRWLQIYIPLWSYSNVYSFSIPKSSFIFTFHYGPIQIISLGTNKQALAKFTFHYGPIQIKIFSFNYDIFSEFTFHYGPIQILYKVSFDIIYALFTFHYGPIQMCEFCYHKNE